MGTYNTIVVVSRDIYERIALYRKILEKSEFGTVLNQAKFISEDSAGDLSPTESFHAENMFYLYGLLDKEKYVEYYSRIEQQRKQQQNLNYYMLFCCKMHSNEGPFDVSERADQSVKRTFAFGIVEDDSLQKEKTEGEVQLSEEEKEDIRCIKLICSLMAMVPRGRTDEAMSFDTYFTLTDVQLSYKHIYFSALYELSRYGETLTELKTNIKNYNAIIEELRAKKPVHCRGKYAPGGPEVQRLDAFSSYRSMEEVRRSLENAYFSSSESVQKFIDGKINVARMAMAEAEKHNPASFVRLSEGSRLTEVEIEEEHPEYMTLVQVEKKDAVLPAEIFDRPEKATPFAVERLGAALPLARAIEKRDKAGFGKILGATLLGVLGFAVFVALVYLVRYFATGFNGVDWYDFALVVGIPTGVILVVGLLGNLILFLQSVYCKHVFKQLYKALQAFLDSVSKWCDSVVRYIDKYLTVFYNYHVKETRIKRIENEIVLMQNDIRKIEEQLKPANKMAEQIYGLFGETIEAVGDASEEDADCMSAKYIENEINQYAKTAPEHIPWLKQFKPAAGNMNGGVR